MSVGGNRLPPQAAGPLANPLFFSVQSLTHADRGRTLQLGFVDAGGSVVLNVFTRWPSGDVAIEPFGGQPMAERLHAMCRGADLVGFHRLLQGGLLPESALEAAASLNCLWKRLQPRGLKAVDMDAALALAGAPPLESDDAVAHALAVRELWLGLNRLG